MKYPENFRLYGIYAWPAIITISYLVHSSTNLPFCGYEENYEVNYIYEIIQANYRAFLESLLAITYH